MPLLEGTTKHIPEIKTGYFGKMRKQAIRKYEQFVEEGVKTGRRRPACGRGSLKAR